MTAGYYPLVPAREDWLERRIRALEQQVKELQAGRGLASASFSGSLRFVDSAGAPRHVFGAVDLEGELADAGYGDFVFGDGGAMIHGFREGDRGWMLPSLPLRTQDFAAVKSITSSTFTTIWSARVDRAVHEVFYVFGQVDVAAGTTAELKLVAAPLGIGETDVLTCEGSPGWYSFEWVHPCAVGYNDPRGRTEFFEISFQARRASGTGAVNLWEPRLWLLTSRFLHPDATTQGNPKPSP